MRDRDAAHPRSVVAANRNRSKDPKTLGDATAALAHRRVSSGSCRGCVARRILAIGRRIQTRPILNPGRSRS